MNIPNMITMARLFMTGLVFVCMQVSLAAESVDTNYAWIAFWLFIVAALSDFLDGYLARRWNIVTAFGRIADPFADKILITGTLVMLLQFEAATEILTHWYVVIVVGREFLVTAIRGVVEASGQAFGADRLGKWKMVTQCWTVGALMLLIVGIDWFAWPAFAGFWVSLLLTVVSGLNYVIKARHVILKGGL